jgi:hypothetical protein
MTTITMLAPTLHRRAHGTTTPACTTQLAVPTSPAVTGHPAGFCYATVNLAGRLSVMDIPTGGTGLFPLGRRTSSGTVYRVDLGDGIACWLDGDHLGQCINPVAAQLCLDLSGGTFIGPDDAPFVCGPVLFTGRNATGPVGLSDSQLRRIVDAHALAATGEPCDPDLTGLADLQVGLA